jgi:magnesium transporter
MSPDFVAVYTQATQREALDRVRRAAAPADSLAWIFVVTPHRRYRGAVALPDLVRAGADVRVIDLIAHGRSLTTGAELEEIARVMTDYDLTVVPVVDDADRPVGVITVDDVLELVIPPPGRRFGLFGGS